MPQKLKEFQTVQHAINFVNDIARKAHGVGMTEENKTVIKTSNENAAFIDTAQLQHQIIGNLTNKAITFIVGENKISFHNKDALNVLHLLSAFGFDAKQHIENVTHLADVTPYNIELPKDLTLPFYKAPIEFISMSGNISSEAQG